MTTQQEDAAKVFFAMLYESGITEALCLKPPQGGSVNAKIEKNGDLSAVDQRDGKRKKIKMLTCASPI